jgi:hypothetical protein
MTLHTRLSKLESTASPEEHRVWRRVIGRSKGMQARRALIDAGQAPADNSCSCYREARGCQCET